MSLVAKLKGVRETAARMALLGELARNEDLAAFVSDLDTLGRAALERDPDAEEIMFALMRPSVVFADSERLNALADKARELGAVLALQWLWSAEEWHAAAVRPPTAKTLGKTGSPSAQSLVDRAMASLTLGDRRALARRADRDQLTRLAGDPDPVVVEHVLANPRTTESLVVTACSRRPTVTTALETVIRSVWMLRRGVRLALVHNPYLAVHSAVPLLFTLPLPEIAAVRDDESLNGRLRLTASRICIC
ncbi:MAG: hypothetical protein H7Z43_03425 [Clostridia bacterium]|nr:hypothetical protein [Deltaproteobacteria bacterium]